jgi:hypothetical protein
VLAERARLGILVERNRAGDMVDVKRHASRIGCSMIDTATQGCARHPCA